VAFKSESKARAFEKYLKSGSVASSLAVISDFALNVSTHSYRTRNFDLERACSGCAVANYQDVFVDGNIISPMPIVTPG